MRAIPPPYYDKSKRDNIRFIAVGKYQVELYEKKSRPYFCIYYPAHDYSLGLNIDLSTALVSTVSDSRFYLIDGSNRFEMLFTETRKGIRLSFYKYLWGRFRWKSYTGIVTAAGADLIKESLASCRQGLAA